MLKKLPTYFIPFLSLILILVFTVLPCSAWGLEWNGYFQTEHRSSLAGDKDYSWQETILALQPEIGTAWTNFYADIHLRAPSSLTNENLSSAQLELNEAYLDLYSFPHKAVDLRIGKQIVTWGTGYQLSPTDNINPLDMRDIFANGEKLGINAIQAGIYLKNTSITAILAPSFTAAALPGSDMASLMALSSFPIPDFDLPSYPTIILEDPVLNIGLPKNNFAQSGNYGLRLKRSFFNMDFSLSFVEGRYSLPVPKNIMLKVTDNKVVRINVQPVIDLVYPRRQVVGLDFAGTKGPVGYWGEVAVHFPERVDLNFTTEEGSPIPDNLLPDPITALSNNNYLKYLFGFDYHGNKFYLNTQYVHGFPQEIGDGQQGNYLVGRLEFSFLNEKLKVPLNACLEIRDFKKIKESSALLFSPEITYYPNSDTEITLSLRLIDGEKASSLSKLKGMSGLGLKFKYSF